MEKFVQRILHLNPDKSTGILKVEKLFEVIKDHPYLDLVKNYFKYDEIRDEFIRIDCINELLEEIVLTNESNIRTSIVAQNKHIGITEETILIDGKESKNVVFIFDEYGDSFGEVKRNLKAIAKYNSKNSYLDGYSMTKYANYLFKISEPALAQYNVDYFKDLATKSEHYNKHRSYRLVSYDGNVFLRGITSVDKYFEYGVDFAFVVSMLALHLNMKTNKGIEYSITSASLCESKLEIIVSEKHRIDAGAIGKIGTSIKITTNDLGSGSLNFQNIINVGKNIRHGFFLIPKNTSHHRSKVLIPHTTKPENALETLVNMDFVFNTSEDFIQELNDIKGLKTPDELRYKIFTKLEHPRSALKGITGLADIFKRKIDNEISGLAKLIEMCEKAEELNIDYELKDKLRYIISDIILGKK